MQRGHSQRNLRRARLRLGMIVNEHLVPINLQIRHQPNAPRACGQLAGQIHHDCALQPRRETHIVRNSLPLAIGQLCFNVRRDGLHARLPRCIERGRAEVIHIAGHQQPQRRLRVHGAQIKCQCMQIGKSVVRQRGKSTGKFVIALAHLIEHIAALAIPRAHR